MKEVGIRELKNRLSEYLRLVRRGEKVVVTDRGEVVAELGQPGRSLEDLARRGGARIGSPNRADLYPALPRLVGDGGFDELLDAERGPR